MRYTISIMLLLILAETSHAAEQQKEIKDWQVKTKEILLANFPNSVIDVSFPQSFSVWVFENSKSITNGELIAKTYCDFSRLATKPERPDIVLSIVGTSEEKRILAKYVCD